MQPTLRDALLMALKLKATQDDPLGMLYFLRGWLSVQPERDEELEKAIEEFVKGCK